jgi:hypothetical protein
MATAPTAPMVDAWPQVSTGQITFYWRAPASDGGDPITKYTLSCAAISYSQDVSATRLDFTVTGLTDKTDYVFQITATNGVGASPATTFPVVQPGATPFGPSVATASTLNTSTALVSWTPSTLATEGALRAYSVQVIPSTPAISSYFITMFPFKSTMAIAGLSTNTYYQFLVRGVNDAGYCAPFAYTSTLGFGIIPTQFSPSSLTGMQLWLDAAQITGYSNSQAITSWADRSPSPLSNTTSGSPSAPTYRTNQMNGLPIVRFNSGYINLGSTLQIGTDPGQSIFTVLKFNETVNNVAIIGRNNEAVGRWGVDRYQGLLRYFVHTPSGFAAAEFTNNNNVSSQILNVSWDRSVASMYINAELKKSNAFSSSDNIVNSSLLGIGAMLRDNSWFINADVAETLYYNRGLTPFDRQKVEGYLAWKWGLTANLPTTHPFKTAAPINTSVFSPSTFGGMALWLDAADPTTVIRTQSTVTQWNDKSGLARNFTTTSTDIKYYVSSPVNSLPSLNFTNYAGMSNTFAFSSSNQLSFFIVCNQTSNNAGGGNSELFANAQDYRGFDLFTGSGTSNILLHLGSGTPVNSGSNIIGKNALVSVVSTSNAGSLGVNGSTLAVFTPGQIAPLSTSYRYNIGGTQYIGNICEILAYSGGLSTDDRQTVEGYLAWKWGLQGSLPAAHPYRNQNPASLVSPTPYFATNFNNGNDANLVNYASSNLSTNTLTNTGFSYRPITTAYMYKSIPMATTNTVTLCASIYITDDTVSWPGLIFTRNPQASGMQLFQTTRRFAYSWNNDNGTVFYNTGYTVPMNTWTHLVLAISPTQATFYANGSSISVASYTHVALSFTDWHVGTDPGELNRTFGGLIDNVAVYNTTLTAAQISSIYAQTLLV